MFSELHLFIIFFVSIILRNDQKIAVGHLIEALCIHFLQPRTLRTRADTPHSQIQQMQQRSGHIPASAGGMQQRATGGVQYGYGGGSIPGGTTSSTPGGMIYSGQPHPPTSDASAYMYIQLAPSHS
jgi:hypothetical protein